MKNFFKYLFLLLFIAAAAGFIYWEKNKKQIVKGAIQTTVGQKTDSLYSIHYDSSEIDEINGNAVFYNVRLQQDSLQKELLKSSGNLPKVLLNVHVSQVGAIGVNVPGLLSNETISAKIIYLKEIFIEINYNNIQLFELF